MWRLAIVACLCVTLGGCAIGRVMADGEIVGMAIGHAQLERTVTPTTLSAFTAEPAATTVTRIQGGALSVSGWEFLGWLVAGAITYFTGGAL